MMDDADFGPLGGTPAQISPPTRVYKHRGCYIYRNTLDDVPPEEKWVLEYLHDGGHDVVFYRTRKEAFADASASGDRLENPAKPSWLP